MRIQMKINSPIEQLRKTLLWFHDKHPEMNQYEILNLMELLINKIGNGETKKLDNGYEAVTLPNVPYSIPDKDIQELADVIAELLFPSDNEKVH